MSISFGQGIVGEVAQTGIPEIIKDTRKDPRYIEDDQVRLSEITVPIITNGKVIGIIDSEHPEKNHYTKEHLQTLENVSSLVAMQLKNAVNLEKRIKAEETNSRLLLALEKSNKELEEYAHIVSHDLKSPLHKIYAILDWVKEDNKKSFGQETLSNISLIEETLEKMEQLISDILEYSSITSDASEKENKKVDVTEIIDDVITKILVPKHITIHVGEKMPKINADPAKIGQLFQNLLANAIRYNDKENGRIEINSRKIKSGYEFSISDNGMGIEKEYHDKIFKIFQTLHKSEDSTGIGLSIVKKIVDLYQGKIWLESEPGVGSTFYFTILN